MRVMEKRIEWKAVVCTAIFLILITGLYLSGHGQSKQSYQGAAAVPIEKYQININTAAAEDLVRLDSLGEKTAQAIIDYREENGPFQTIEDIQNVKGIGEKKFAMWKEFLCVS